jgi:hypothetical protein
MLLCAVCGHANWTKNIDVKMANILREGLISTCALA